MWTGTSRTQVQSPTDMPITLTQNPSCAESFWLCKLTWPGSESGPLLDFFLRDCDPKKGTDFGEKKMCKSYGYNWGVDSNLHVKVVTTGLCLVSTGYTQKNDAVSKVNKKFISCLILAQRTRSAAATVQISHALPAVRFSCLLLGRGASFQDGVAAGKVFLCAPFWGVQICDCSAA